MMKKISLLLWIGTIGLLIPATYELSESFPLFQSTPLSQPALPSIPSFGIQKIREKREAPSFSLMTLNGSQISLSDYKGKPILLKFWATWCPSCVEELPQMEKFSAGKGGQLCILTLVIDGEKKKRVEGVVKKNRVTLPVLLDVKEKIARTYRVTFIPAAFLVDREGMLIGTIVGERDWSSPEAWSAIKEVLDLH